MTAAATGQPSSFEARAELATGEMSLIQVPHGGKGAAVQAGMLAARGDLVVFTDADMATPPDELAPIVRALESADAVYGSRIQPDGSDMRKSQPPWRRVAWPHVPRARLGVGGGAGAGHAVRFQGLPPGARARCLRHSSRSPASCSTWR